MNMKIWWFFFRLERALKILALWLFFYRFNVRFPLHGAFGMKGSPDVCHGPTSWPRWKLFAVNVHRAAVHAPSWGWCFWIYTPRGGAPTIGAVDKLERRNVGRCIDVFIDRRPLAALGVYL
jgi:hypothetical protein